MARKKKATSKGDTRRRLFVRPLKYWFTSVWQYAELCKETKKPSYLLGLLNLVLAPLVVSVVSILILKGGFANIDLAPYPPVILVSLAKYGLLAFAFAFVVAATKKVSLRKMFYMATFPLAGYLVLVDSSLIMAKLIAGFPTAIALKSLLILFVIAETGIAKEEAKMDYWAAGLWAIAALALADWVGPQVAALVASL